VLVWIYFFFGLACRKAEPATLLTFFEDVELDNNFDAFDATLEEVLGLFFFIC